VGLCAGGRDVIGAMYQAEFMPEKYHVIAMTGVNCVDSTTMIFQAIYYHYCKDWLYLHLFGLCVAILIIFLIQVIPESPKYLYTNKKFDECRRVFIFIARWNNVSIKPEEINKIVFDSEMEEDGPLANNKLDNETLV
jgi:hypothetical protein